MAMLTRMFLGGSQLGHFAAASLIRSTYLRCAFCLVRKRNIVEDSVSTRDAGEVVEDPHWIPLLAVRLYMLASILLAEICRFKFRHVQLSTANPPRPSPGKSYTGIDWGDYASYINP
jgi:hypothetical protein